MRFGVVGAGPAGLYLSILLKQADPSHQITVIERNPAGATYGWGVVFSPDTLAELRDADYATYLELDDAIVRWDALDIRYRDRVIRARGQGFSAINRRVLLQLLQGRARDLGVELVFDTELADVDRFADHDVVVAADGINSAIRSPREGTFGTRRHEHGTRFAWFGADLAFDAFTFIFEETPQGLFTVHAYPFDATTSTFIVEVAPDTFHAAGLDEMSEEESLKFCQELFDPHLRGHRLLSNRSVWISFTTLSNRSWHDGNLVLMGDAAHTAHFTIGSGTKLAMEDAVALSKAFVAHGDDLDAAFTEYELERQGPVERFQQAAIDSADWFASVPRYLGFDPEGFAANLLTRSGRVTHADVTRRDPVIGARIERWFAGHDTPRIVVPRPAAVPLAIGPTEVPNRVVVTTTATDTAIRGVPREGHRAALLEAARLGAGLVVTEAVAVSAHGRVTAGSAGLWSDEQASAWSSIIRDVHQAGARVALRLTHSGRRGSTRPRSGGLDRPLEGREAWTTLAPSPLPYTPRVPAPAAVDARRFSEVADDFEAAGARATDAGFDLVLIDLSDGYLLGSFLSPLTNHRDDEYGGPLEARMRWPLAVVERVRRAWAGPTGARLTVDDRVAGGLTPDDGVAIARALADRGVLVIEAVGGHTVPAGAADFRRFYQVPLADRVRNEAGVATITSGHITTLDDIDTVVTAGRADLCVLDPGRYRQERITPRERPA